MKILVLNSGSSSLKFQVFDMPSAKVLVKGLAERIGEKTGKFKANDYVVEQALPTHKEALELLTGYLLQPENNIIKNKNEIVAVGHRVVHGGNTFVQPTLINTEVKEKIKDLFSLAPLHNPANLSKPLKAFFRKPYKWLFLIPPSTKAFRKKITGMPFPENFMNKLSENTDFTVSVINMYQKKLLKN